MLPAVLILALLQNSPTAYCMQAIKRVLRYLEGSQNFAVKYSPGSTNITCFVNSDFVGDVASNESISEYMVKLGDAVCN